MFENHVFSFEFLHQWLNQQLLFLMELKHFLPAELLLLLIDLLMYLISVDNFQSVDSLSNAYVTWEERKVNLIYYIQPFILLTELLLFHCKTLTSFFWFVKNGLSLIFVPSAPPTTPGNNICWIALGSTSRAFYLPKSAAISL